MSARNGLLEQDGDQVIAYQLRLNLTVLFAGVFMSEKGRLPVAIIIIFFAAQTVLEFSILGSMLAYQSALIEIVSLICFCMINKLHSLYEEYSVRE